MTGSRAGLRAGTFDPRGRGVVTSKDAPMTFAQLAKLYEERYVAGKMSTDSDQAHFERGGRGERRLPYQTKLLSGVGERSLREGHQRDEFLAPSINSIESLAHMDL
jgi:hypothetical protein